MISGHKQSGKTTLANIFRAIDKNIYKYSYAEPIRQMAIALYDYIDPEETLSHRRLLSGPDYERQKSAKLLNGITSRQIMQTLGTEWGRHALRQSLWIDILWSRMNADRKSAGVTSAVIDDVRFPDELKLPDNMFGDIVHIHIQRNDNGSYDDEHESESHEPYMHDNAHFLIDNSSSIEALKEVARRILGDIKRNGLSKSRKQLRYDTERDAYGI